MICRAVEIVILTNNAKQGTMLVVHGDVLTEFVAFRSVCLITSILGGGTNLTVFMFSNISSRHSTSKMHNILP